MHMPPPLRHLLQPLNLAGIVTVLAVAASIDAVPGMRGQPLPWLLLLAFVLCFLLNDLPRLGVRGRDLVLWLQAAVALAVVGVAPRAGTAPVLLVIVVAQMAMLWPPRRTLLAALALNLALYAVLRQAGYDRPGLVVVIYAGFQAFAALIGHYARTAERARDQLALVNADLLATRALLADSARHAERLRVARELHDVAGHKLTAMKLNLRALALDPVLAGRDDVRLVQRLATELLDDIRNVVQALRDARGLDLETALRALAAPLPRPRLALDIGADVHVEDPAVAETLLRLVQEALTNAARHGDAATLHVALHRQGRFLDLRIEDDGALRGALREGNGITGMRERVAAAGGEFALATAPGGALRIQARLPA